jgi:hypothetical protein
VLSPEYSCKISIIRALFLQVSLLLGAGAHNNIEAAGLIWCSCVVLQLVEVSAGSSRRVKPVSMINVVNTEMVITNLVFTDEVIPFVVIAAMAPAVIPELSD